MEGANIQNSKETDRTKLSASIVKNMPLNRMLKTIGIGSLFSFAISELIFLYFIDRGISRFPENLVVCLVILSVGIGLESFFFPSETIFLTAFTSTTTLIAIVGYLFGSSTNPSILASFFFISGENRIFLDYLAIGILGTFVWVLLLIGMYDMLRKVRKLSIRGAYLTFSKTISNIASFLDKHPWFATILVSMITLLVGFLIGTKG